ncbi:MEKHLA domain-containing protein [Methylomagnum ishizawai]|uniref:MEKHLA domain-containing protein n=1 Tax=Methylomagnum ishizawai TaxID=1760988 RepID=A0A1Y6CTT5_9GAMM|nr:MEKHLA domain-containing protein [Methylomagnum ishizawai]SMF93600.1 MEKHLA domain-containing protein [Methylomagnum ishizawai]
MTAPPPYPSEDNHYLAEHVALLRDSHRHWTGRPLLDPRLTHEEAARHLFAAPFVVVSHDTAPDPLFNYANQTALALFAMDWEEFTALPSRLSAERINQEARAELLARVAERGYIDDYQGVRIGRHGRRFLIEAATVWNLLDPRGVICGQAACFKHWKFL